MEVIELREREEMLTCKVAEHPEVRVGGNDTRLEHLLTNHLCLLIPQYDPHHDHQHHDIVKENDRAKGEGS